jgi:hypothetical protein
MVNGCTLSVLFGRQGRNTKLLFFMGRRKTIPGGLAAAVLAADTHEK